MKKLIKVIETALLYAAIVGVGILSALVVKSIPGGLITSLPVAILAETAIITGGALVSSRAGYNTSELLRLDKVGSGARFIIVTGMSLLVLGLFWTGIHLVSY